MKKDVAIRIITDCAKEYRENLVNQNLLFVCGTAQNVDFFEVLCSSQNYKHLTGATILDKSITNQDFYDMCINGKLSIGDFELKKDGTTQLKLSVLHQVTNIHRTARMVGEYGSQRLMLNSEKLAGSVSACLGFVKPRNLKGFYVPNTVLSADIREVVQKPVKKVLAIFRKTRDARRYLACTYLSKGSDLDSVTSHPSLKNKFSL